MHFKKRLREVLSLIVLIFTLCAVVATSRSQYSLQTGSFIVASDCVSPAIEVDISITNYQITDPAGWTFTDFGLPQPTLSAGSVISGNYNGVRRVCAQTFGESSAKDFVFSCWDDGEFVCNVHFRAF